MKWNEINTVLRGYEINTYVHMSVDSTVWRRFIYVLSLRLFASVWTAFVEESINKTIDYP